MCCFFVLNKILLYIHKSKVPKDKYWKSKLKKLTHIYKVSFISRTIVSIIVTYNYRVHVCELPVSFNKDIGLEPHCNDHPISCWSIMTNQRMIIHSYLHISDLYFIKSFVWHILQYMALYWTRCGLSVTSQARAACLSAADNFV